MFRYLLIISLIALQQCSSKQSENQLAFYYWKTNLKFDNSELLTANNIGVDKFYVRFFDVDWSEMQKQPVPVAKLNVYYYDNTMPPDNFVPCIYITNKVMQKCTGDELSLLAKRISKKIKKTTDEIDSFVKYSRYDYNQRPDTSVVVWDEIQIDCDWTPKSKENYFYFLKKIKEEMPEKKVSSTLRLWQLKYKDKAGIPPVDKVMLMCYSTGNPKEYNIENSLANYDDLKSYIEGQEYNLPVDIALPVFNWAVLFRNKKFKGLLREIDAESIQLDTLNFKNIEKNRYMFKSDTVIGNTYIRYGDEIRIEKLSQNDMDKLIQLLQKTKLHNSQSTIAFFSWDTTYINDYGYENIQKYYNSFSAN